MLLRAILEAIVLVLVIRAVWRVLGGVITISSSRRPSDTAREPRAVKLVRDPVCGTYVSPASALSDGSRYFCSEKCRDEYKLRA